MQDAQLIERIQTKYRSLGPEMDERLRRQWAAAEAREVGSGGISAVSAATGMSRTTIMGGLRELALPEEERVIEANRIRRSGGGRKSLTETDHGLLAVLESLIEPATRGDPESPLRWTCVESAMETLAKFIKEMGGVDLIVLSAGAGDINNGLSWPLENEVIKTNVTGFAALVNVAMHHFTEKGSGHLVGISSVAALRGGGESPAYNASKAFESNYMEGLRQKVRKSRLPITITDIKPGFINTAMAKGDGIFWAAEPEKAAEQIYQVI